MRRTINNIRNHNNWFEYYIHKYFNKQKEEFTFKGKNKVNITVPKRLMQTYKECFFDETYLKGFPKSVLQKPIHTIVDVGANVGYFSLFMFSRYPHSKIFAFEPMPVNFKLMSRYRDENRQLDYHIMNMAMSDSKQESIILNYNESDSFTTSASIFQNSNEPNNLIVKTTHLSKIMEENNWSTLDFLKLDCEGSEYSILYEASSEVMNKIRMVAIETHPGKAENENKESLLKFLHQHHFKTNSIGDIIWGWKE